MKEADQIEFQKWEGTGNTFIMIDGRSHDLFSLENEVVQSICSREKTDGLIVLGLSIVDGADLKCDFRNPDGTRSFCGNGTRAAYAYARREGWLGDSAVLEACDGLHPVRWNSAADLPSVKFKPAASPIDAVDPLFSSAWFVDTGSPHHVAIYSGSPASVDHSDFDLHSYGSSVRYSDAYTSRGGTNTSILCKTPNGLLLRTYERGVEAETQACGTGAVAAALIDYTINSGEQHRRLTMPGGDLHVEFTPTPEGFDKIWLSGRASELRRGRTSLLATLLILLTFSLQTSSPFAQTPWYETLSPATEISVLTSNPSDEVYSIFGHSALRIHDPGAVPIVDYVFNYGTFSYSDGFYLNFLKGRMDYKLTANEFPAIYKHYINTGRGLNSQRLNLTHEQILQFAEYLNWNLQPENCTYPYEFFRDNCSSRILSLLETNLENDLDKRCKPSGASFREALQPYLNGTPWVAEGINLVLGPGADAPMLDCEKSYIPDSLSQALTRMRINGEPLVYATETLLIPQRGWIPPKNSDKRHLPAILFATFAAALAALRFYKGDDHKATRIIRTSAAVLGCALAVILTAMWTVTDHVDTWANWNLMWTLPAFAYFAKPRIKALGALTILVYISLSLFLIPQFTTATIWALCLLLIVTLTPKILTR